MALLFTPSALNDALAMGHVLREEERYCLQNWGCFCLAIGYIAHAAKSFDLRSQREVAKGMALCFACATGNTIWAISTNNFSPEYARGAGGIGVIFLGLLGAYSVGLITTPSK